MKSLARRLRSDRRGIVTMMAGFGIIAFVGFTAIVVDVGYLVYAKRVLQNSTDAAALAGAQDINKGSGGTATSTATSYSATAGNNNAVPGLTVTMASGYPALRCFSSTGISCSGPDNANGIVVRQNATVPLFFGRVLGLNSATITASAAAGRAGGAAQPLDVMIVLDTTASMNTVDTTCAVSGATRLTCALTGFRRLLSGFDPSLVSAGLVVFPGLKATTSPTITAAQNAQREYDCSTTTPASSAIAAYDESPLYLILPLSNDYQQSDGSLNPSSNLVKAARGAASSGCGAGITAYGGVGTFYADAVTQAKTYLTSNGRTGVQKMIIVLSDGDAGASSSNMPSGRSTNQCRQGITAAQAATSAGMQVVTVAYGAPTSATGSCPTDYPRIAACDTLRQMASTSANFYSDNANSGTTCNSAANPVSDLNDIFQSIGTSVGTGARLLPDNTT